MRIFKSAKYLTSHLNKLSKEGKKIGFVPTMGALHMGHMSLIKQARKKSDYVVASIFVNPTQFNDPNDLKKYPRTPKQDMDMLKEHGCDLLFMPSAKEIYPNKKLKTIDLDFGDLDKVMEGAHRPGHFAGVAAVVKRLLDIVVSDGIFMGQKDFQQTAIINHMLTNIGFKTKLHICPIIREKDGLAMSSRNRRLTDHFRLISPIINKTLKAAKKDYKTKSASQISKAGIKSLEQAGLKPEYFEIVDGDTLKGVRRKASHKYVVICAAAWAGEIRLIDNIIVSK